MLPDLSTPRLHLRPAVPEDLDALWAIWAEPEVRRFLFDDVPVPRERAEEVLSSCLSQVADGLGLWTIRLRNQEEEVIGCAGLTPVGVAAENAPRLAGKVEPVVALAPGCWHRGYATEALQAVIAYGFGPLGLRELVGVADIPNVASRLVLTRLGFEAVDETEGPRYRLRIYRLYRQAFEARAQVTRSASA